MSSRPKNPQVWECPRCSERYEPALPATAILCPHFHSEPNKPSRVEMKLISGTIPTVRK